MRALLALVVFTGGAMAQEPAPGLKLTVESVADGVAHSQRVRLLALHVERRESPAPFLAPGMFRAKFAGTLPVPVRDKYRFQATGKGTFELRVNGEVALQGQLVPGNTVESAAVRLKKGDNEVVATIESSALGEATLRLHWSLEGAFGWEPVAPGLWRCADDADLQRGALLAEGQTLFAARRCAHCHAPARALGESAYGELAVMGPDLRTAGARLSPAWVTEWLQDPRKLRSDVRMPRLPGLGAVEAEHMAAWLASAGAPAAAVSFTAQQADQGAVRFRELGCIACHQAPGDTAAAEGRIELRNVAAKWRSKGLVEWLLNPRSQHPDSRMPDFALHDEDAAALAAFLLRGREGEPATVRGGDAVLGKQLAAKAGCVRCHAADTADATTFAPLQSLDPQKGCLADAPASAPDHGLTAWQRAALRAYLPHAQDAPFRRSPADFAARQIRELRCTACHGFDGLPSAWAGFAHPSGKEPPARTEDPVAQGVPALTWAGARLQPSWLERFVTGKAPSPRPWLTARMPRFHHDGPAVVQGVARQHGYAFQDEPPGPADGLLAVQGARLVKKAEGFGCVDCHAIGNTPAQQVFEREGVNLQLAGSRVRHEYFRRWMLDAPRIDADSRMPKWTDARGRTGLTDVLGGDAVQQFEAIWQYLQTLR